MPMPGISMMGAAGSVSAVPLIGTFRGNTKSSTDASSYNWGSQTIGAAPTGGKRRFVFVAASGTTNVTAITIGGSAATLLTSYGATGRYVRIGYLEVPSGTSVSLAHTHGSSSLNAGVAWWTVETSGSGFSVLDDVGGTSDSQSLDANVVDGGFVIAANNRDDTATITWVGVTAQYNQFIESTSGGFNDHYHSGADHTVTANETPRTISSAVTGTVTSVSTVASLKPL